MDSEQSSYWKAAMDEEMVALKRNEAFTVTALPPLKTVVGGRWVYAINQDQKIRSGTKNVG